MARSFFLALLAVLMGVSVPAWTQESKPAADQSATAQESQEQEPPEEDEELSRPEKEYTFNPLQAENVFKVGNFYFKKGSYKSAISRYEEATKWNPGYAEAYLKLGEAREKNGNLRKALAAYEKYLELSPDAKNADVIRKKLKDKR